MDKACKIKVYLDDIVGTLQAYELDKKGWNGWACPGFELKQAKQVMEQLAASCPNVEWEYHAKFKTFLLKGMGQEPEAFTAQSYATVDGEKTLYSIGAWGWVWSIED